jgi:DNA polymerase-3 subunit delta
MGTFLLTGDDESILRQAVLELVHELVGDGDRSMMVDEFDGADFTLGDVATAAQTPAFLTDRRIVVARGIGRFVVADTPPLVQYLADPLPSTELVLVGGGGAVPKALPPDQKNGPSGCGRGQQPRASSLMIGPWRVSSTG